jgi:ABC-2 type transport system ATP-binding protein
MAGSIIHTDGLTKYFGENRGVVGLELDVHEGEVFGYLGANGAGKTTTIRMLLDIIRPTQGKATVFGLDSHKQSLEIRRDIGYLPGELSLYDGMSGAEFLRYSSNLRGGSTSYSGFEIAERLSCDLARPIRDLSHGNKQKLGLIQAFMHRPRLIILDEPSQGLDPLVQREFYTMVDEVKQDGRTVFLSSHVLPEAERVCDRVGFIRDGKMIAVERIEDMKARALRYIEVQFEDQAPLDAINSIKEVKDLLADGNTLRFAVEGSMDSVIKAISQYHVVNLVSREPDLEEMFMAYYERGGGIAE